MGDMADRGVFANPLILHSEHKRVLGDAIKRGDERAVEANRRGFWRGVACTIWITGGAVYFALIAGFNFGLRVSQ